MEYYSRRGGEGLKEVAQRLGRFEDRVAKSRESFPLAPLSPAKFLSAAETFPEFTKRTAERF